MVERRRISARQQQLLESARSTPPHQLVRNLFRFVMDEEHLDPAWKPIWISLMGAAGSESLAPQDILERIDKVIQKLEFIEEEILKIRLESGQGVCLLLGAGASASEPTLIPTVAELLPELWRRARKLGREDIDRLRTWCNENAITNIEDLLTAAYLANFAAKSSKITGLLDVFLFGADKREEAEYREFRGLRGRRAQQVNSASIAIIQDTLQILFGLLTGQMIEPKPNLGHHAIVKFVKEHPRASIVTTNYDGCIDEALLRGSVPTNTIVDEDLDSSDAIHLVKIHGSINWYYCESCHDVKVFNLLRLKELFEKDDASYAVIGICKKCGGQRKPLLIPPMGLKIFAFPNLIRLWNTARDQLEEAQYLISVGYSFSEADAYINKIIERSMSRNESQRLIVCDPDPLLARNLRARFAARIDGFDADHRILAATGKSHETLPRVLESMSKRDAPVISAEAAPPVVMVDLEKGRKTPLVVSSDATRPSSEDTGARPPQSSS